jgi:hypothetical protein
MTVPLDSGDKRFLLLSAGLLAVLTLLALLVPSASEEPSRGYPSSYSAAKDGARAAFSLLEEMGYRPEHWTESPAALPAGGATLIIASPMTSPSAEERVQLKQFAQRGGRLLLTGMSGALMIGAMGVGPAREITDESLTFHAEQAAPLTRHAPEIAMESDVRWTRLRADEQRYYGDAGGATVVKFSMGEGEVIWWAGDTPLINSGISRAANLALFLNSVGPAGQTHVLWDEYFHGVRQGLWHYLARTPLPWAVLQISIFAAFVILTFGRRSGPVRPITLESRLSPLEFVATLGALYQRKGEAAGALEIAFSHFRFQLSRKLGIPSSAAPQDVIQRVEQKSGGAIPQFAGTIGEIAQALELHTVTESNALAWIGDLHDFSVRLGLQPVFDQNGRELHVAKEA